MFTIGEDSGWSIWIRPRRGSSTGAPQRLLAIARCNRWAVLCQIEMIIWWGSVGVCYALCQICVWLMTLRCQCHPDGGLENPLLYPMIFSWNPLFLGYDVWYVTLSCLITRGSLSCLPWTWFVWTFTIGTPLSKTYYHQTSLSSERPIG